MKVTVDRRRLRARMIEEDKNSLIKALKQDDAKAAKQALTGMSGEDLGLGHKEFGDLTNEIDFAARQKPGYDAIAMDAAREILKIQGKDTKQSTSTHNPVTGQPWSSGPVKGGQQQKKLGQMTAKDFDSHRSSASPEDQKFEVGDKVVFLHSLGGKLTSKIVKIGRGKGGEETYYLANPRPGSKPDVLGPVYADEITSF